MPPPLGGRVTSAAEGAQPATQFNTRLTARHRAMLRELAAGRTLRLALEDAIDALADARHTEPRAALDVAAAKEPTVQFNTGLSHSHRVLLDDLVANHPLGRLATLRMVTEEAIAALYAARFGEGSGMT